MWSFTWNGEKWQDPSLVYLIRQTSDDEHKGIHIHAIHSVVQGGNRLITTFTNSPSEDQQFLYVMMRDLDGVESVPIMPTPTHVSQVDPTPIPTRDRFLEPTPIAHQPFDANVNINPSSPAGGVWFSLVPTMALVGLVMLVGVVIRFRAR